LCDKIDFNKTQNCLDFFNHCNEDRDSPHFDNFHWHFLWTVAAILFNFTPYIYVVSHLRKDMKRTFEKIQSILSVRDHLLDEYPTMAATEYVAKALTVS